MALSTISAKVDSEDKKEFERFCEDVGMNVSVCINMFIKQVTRYHKLPFEVSSDPFYSKQNMERIRKSIEDVKNGKASLTEHELIEEQ